MRTIVIWDTQIDPISFFILEGDYRRLDRVYINAVEADEKLEKELLKLVYHRGRVKVRLLSTFPTLLQASDHVIVAGFLP